MKAVNIKSESQRQVEQTDKGVGTGTENVAITLLKNIKNTMVCDDHLAYACA